MEKQKPKPVKKKQTKRIEEDFLETDIPECPKLEDFDYDAQSKPANHASSSKESQNADSGIEAQNISNIESEIFNASQEDVEAAQEADDLPRNYKKEREKASSGSTAECAISTTDVCIELSDSEPMPFQKGNMMLDKVSNGTEMKEMHSYHLRVSPDKNEQDTKLESPLHTTERLEEPPANAVTKKEAIRQPEPQPVVASAPPESEVPQHAPPEVRPFTEAQLVALCTNPELEATEDVAAEFVDAQLRGGGGRLQQHPLYTLLISYLRARQRLAAASAELANLEDECRDHQQHLWIVETTSVTESGECQDGNPVSATHEYKVAHMNRNELAALARSLASVRDVVHQTHSLACYSAEVIWLQAEHYVQGVEASCGASQLPHNAPAALAPCEEVEVGVEEAGLPGGSPQQRWGLLELRHCVSVLFTFQRRPIKDDKFIADCRGWLSRLVALLVRLATWRDHLFLLHHVLRCPAGVGSWAAPFVQTPPPPPHRHCAGTAVTPGGGVAAVDSAAVFASPYLRHAVAVLATLVRPVREREHFLEQAPLRGDPAPSEPWVLVDSDGEEDEDTEVGRGCGAVLRENDLVAILNQIPFDAVFRHVLLVDRRDDRDLYDPSLVTEQHVLRLFAFCTVLVRLLRTGLATYSSPRYRQFGRRLGRLIRHTVQYVSDQWQSLRNGSRWVDPALALRLQAEYDAFFLRATRGILSSQGLGTWQFLAVIPYSVVSLHTLWHLYYLLHLASPDNADDDLDRPDSSVDWERRLADPQVQLQFEEKLTSMPEAESYYLLTTFANMAVARGSKDADFVRCVTLDLLEVGFLSAATRDLCSKTARSLLAGVTAEFPALLSVLLANLQDNFERAGKMSLYLFRELPLRQWRPGDADLSLLSEWLLHRPLATPENQLARLVLAGLDWGLAPGGRELVLPLEVHRRAASLVVEACDRHEARAGPPSGGTVGAVVGGGAAVIAEGVKQVSSLVVQRTPPQSHEHALSLWAWEMLARLRLHALDQPRHAVWTAMADPASAAPPRGADDDAAPGGPPSRHPVALLASVLGSGWGHSPPLVAERGLPALHALAAIHGRYEQVAAALELVIPLMLDCADSVLLKSDRYSAILMSLLTADRTYMKMAKNLIAPEFPGPVLRMFGNMVQCQLENYRRYSLASPRELVRLWLLSMAQLPDWTRESGAVYVADIVLRCAFFYPDARDVAVGILADLHQQATMELEDESAAGLRAGGTLSALISWVASGSGTWASLVPRCSAPDAPWLAYFALEVEHRAQEERPGLWRELLRELASTQGKANVDQALKRAAHTLKVPAPTSSSLAVYRWAQQALDTPLGHPLLPLLWQKFFELFLARIPSTPGVVKKRKGSVQVVKELETACLVFGAVMGVQVPDRGGVGDKFFEGMVNLNMLKKLKRRLQETEEFYRNRSRDPGLEEEAVKLNTRCADLMRTFALWLEEPRLHEPSLFLPALPPQYDSQKLALVLQGDRRPWLEYLDYEAVRTAQQNAVREWQALRFRGTDKESDGSSKHRLARASSEPEDAKDPAHRIVSRLQLYDTPVPPPPLRPSKPVIPSIQADMLQNRAAMLSALKSSFRAITEFAQIYSLRVSEHTALDCSLLELVPSTYRDVEMEVLLHAACDTGPDAARRKPHDLICAGPADIRLKVCEARISEGTEHMIQQNRAEYDTLLSRAMQPPPQKVCVGSVFVEHAISLLEREYSQYRARGSVEVTARVQDVGVALFHHIVGLYGEDVALYPPSKQLLTGCLETLGQVFVSGDESQGCRLLATLLEQPRLAGILGPHFTPSAASTTTFLQMYQTVVETAAQAQQPVDLCFVLLSKFDVTRWLMTRKPRLSERSQFIELVGKALTAAGICPEDDKLILHEVFRKHLRLMLLFDFPEHYGEVLSLVLRASETQQLAPSVWFDLLNALLQPAGAAADRLKPGLGAGTVREEARRFATEQRSLSHSELRETVTLLGSHFTKERLQYGLYGLYPKYRAYVEPLTAFFAMLGHAIVVSSVQLERGALSDQLCERHLWPALSEMFSPWLAPYWTRNLREPAAAWIQQLADDRSVLLPWIVADGAHAQRFVGTFVECVRFVLDTLPGCSNMLSFVWQFYVNNFAHAAVKDYILNVLHGGLLTLSWDRFWPGLNDLELMLKVVDQYLPDCHQFLGGMFVEVAWWSWVGHVLSTFPPALTARAHACLLHLLVKLSCEPSVRQSTKLLPLLLESRRFAWHLLDSTAFESIANWYVMSCDPRVILAPEDTDDDDTGRSIDIATLGLLRVSAAHIPEAVHFHPQTLTKRQTFVRVCVKLLTNCAGRHKALLLRREKDFRSAVGNILEDVECVVSASVPSPQQVAECGFLLSEVVPLAAQPQSLAPLALSELCSWLASRDGRSCVLRSLLKVAAPTLASSPQALGAVLEAALEAFFRMPEPEDHQGGLGTETDPRPTWQCAVSMLSPPALTPALEEALTSGGHVLTLHALLLKKLPSCRDIREEAAVLAKLTDWMGAVKPGESVEAKLALLWGRCLMLAQRQCEFSEDTEGAISCLRTLVSRLLALAEDRTWGSTLLGAIGLRRPAPVTNKCRLLSRAVAVFVLAQLPDGEQPFVRTTPSAPGALSMPVIMSRSTGSVDQTVPNPSAQALSALSQLEALATNKAYQDLKPAVELAVRLAVDPDSSLHSGCGAVATLAHALYGKAYLAAVKD
ncbi:ectopic P granules protein 5 homolog isoform X1 [Schistocerca gregaria]|uniref:ectopic P granules protein 5 homolog isoform X1 n=1 Tax=Schistocerca gregaria TaxID=7010 RepID=UPI00211EFB18|nr:ectopic P granules protein 5 homolog isoform X1 [Schistocerca gregaria]